MADAVVALDPWIGEWTVVRQGQSAHVGPGDCSRRGGVLTVAAHHIKYSGDRCGNDPVLRLDTDCEVPQVAPQGWDTARYAGDLEDLVHQSVVQDLATHCDGPFREIMVLDSGDLLIDVGNYYVFRRRH